MRALWNHMEGKRGQSAKTYLMFLVLHTLLWFVPLAVVAAAICLGLSLQAPEVIRFTGLISGYPALIFGFFGGILFLMRRSGMISSKKGN